jgi:flagellin
MKTLATQSASTTFTGDRTTLNNEFQSLVGEIDQQASNIGLVSGGSFNTAIQVYIGGGGAVQANSIVTVDLSGTANRADSTALGVSGSSLLAAGSAFGTVNLNGLAAVLAAGANGSTQTFTFNTAGGGQFTAQIASTSSAGITVAQAVTQLNNTISAHGITASVDAATGHLLLSSSQAFTASAAAATGGTGLAVNTDVAVNGALYRVDQGQATNKPVLTFAGVAATKTENLTFTSGGNSIAIALTPANAGSATTALQTLNTQLSALGISAVLGTGGDIEFQSATSFTITKAASDAGVFALAAAPWTDTAEVPTATGSATGNSLSALTAITSAVANLGLVQGRVGAGQNMLQYAINLAKSQISNFSSAESSIRDADVAAEAANLTKAAVLQQASMAAMAQANSAPQAVLALLRG